jgi:hypothetical protein
MIVISISVTFYTLFVNIKGVANLTQYKTTVYIYGRRSIPKLD